MEDVQDGIKVSIQDGVTEDPELIGSFDVEGKSYLALAYIIEELKCPTITSVFTTGTDSEDLTSSITSIWGTAVA